ncbi:trypsin-like peptidase domain-containing protein, partial [Rothia kristinae]
HEDRTRPHPWAEQEPSTRPIGADAGAQRIEGTRPAGTAQEGTRPAGSGQEGTAQESTAAYPTWAGQASGARTQEQAAATAEQPTQATQTAAYGYGYGEGGYGGGDGGWGTAGQPIYQPASPRRDRRRFGAGTLIAGMAVAALIGGGAAAGTTGLIEANSASTSSSSGSGGTTIVNDHSSVNEVTAAAQKASPSVVTIAVTGSGESGTGSGVILDKQGHILTNTHVVTLDGATANATAEVQLSDGSVRSAQVVGTDPTSDLAVLKIDANGLDLTPATLGDSSKLNVGDTAVAIGSPLGLSGTVTDGIVSNLNRTISVASSAAPEGGDTEDSSQGSPFQFQFPDKNGRTQTTQSNSTISLAVLQTDAAINPGNSGGALVNKDGEVIGINVAIASAGSSSGSESSGSTGNIGVGFSIPVDYAKRVAQEIIDDGHATHGLLGASVASSPADGDKSQTFSDGAVIKRLSSDGPAQQAGLSTGDVITELDGRQITDAESLTASVREAAAGQKVTVKYQRNGSEKTAEVTLGSASDSSSSSR